MKKYEKVIVILFMLIAALIFLSFTPLSAQINLFPWSFGTTSVNTYGAYPFSGNYLSSLLPYYGYGLFGGLNPGLGGTGYPSGISPASGFLNIMKAMQYYQYLNYAYQFYMVARSTPMFYMYDITADYIGSSLYSFAQKNSLSPQEAIITFIQQNLL